MISDQALLISQQYRRQMLTIWHSLSKYKVYIFIYRSLIWC